MLIADNILRNKLKNVYFITGSGKTTIANEISKHLNNCYVYHTDNRGPFFKLADPKYQPAMCRNVPDYFALDKDDAYNWECNIVKEFTPMILIDLIYLSSQYDVVICEGDINLELIIDVIVKENMVYIKHIGKTGDFFDRPEQRHMLDSIINDNSLSEEEKKLKIEKMYDIVGRPNQEIVEDSIPDVIKNNNIKVIVRYDNNTVEENTNKVLKCFKLNK